MPKHFPSKKDASPAPLVEFSLDAIRETVVEGRTEQTAERHEFAARPRMSYGDVLGMVKNEDNARALTFLDRMIRRALINDDGTPERWTPRMVDDHFTAPNGDHTPAGQLPRFEEFEAGSSRRRWAQLITSDDVTIDMDQVNGVMEYLTEEAAGRPNS